MAISILWEWACASRFCIHLGIVDNGDSWAWKSHSTVVKTSEQWSMTMVHWARYLGTDAFLNTMTISTETQWPWWVRTLRNQPWLIPVYTEQ
jgi:hypothetical protein